MSLGAIRKAAQSKLVWWDRLTVWKKRPSRVAARMDPSTITRLPPVLYNNNHNNNFLIKIESILHQILKTDACLDKSKLSRMKNRKIGRLILYILFERHFQINFKN